MRPVTVRPAAPTDFPALCPMLLAMGFVEDGEALAVRFPAFCAREDFALLVAEDGEGRLLGYAALHDHGPHLRYVFWYANDHSAAPAYERMGYRSAGAGQEGDRFFEIDLGEANTRTPHPLRGS